MSNAPPSPRPRGRALAYWLPPLAWLLVMLYFSSVPDPYARVHAQGTTLTDIVAHFVGFLVLAALVLRWWCFRTRETTRRRILQAVALCLLYSIFDELHQIPIPGRSFDWIDLVTDAVGVAVGVGAVLLFGARRRGA